MKIGIIGNGFVGNAIAFAFSPVFPVRIYDIDPLFSTNTLDEVVQCDVVFICIPTPMKAGGGQDLTAMDKLMLTLSKKDTKSIFVIKSTVLPGTTRDYSVFYPKLRLVFSPEFLTERTAKLDMMTQTRLILGGESDDTFDVRVVFEQRFSGLNIITCSFESAEVIKYISNCFFALKVSFMNEFYQLCDAIGADWEDVVSGFVADGRVANSHLNVPGPDGLLGFGGTCFPKDINAMIHFSELLEVEMNTLKGAWKTNLIVRPEKDWENLKGRAVV